MTKSVSRCAVRGESWTINTLDSRYGGETAARGYAISLSPRRLRRHVLGLHTML